LKKLFLNVFIFSFPLLICLGFFVIGDPFAIFHKTNGLVESSEDVVKTRLYLRNFGEKNYTAFMFGNSRVHGFLPEDWQTHIGRQNVFDFAAPGESLLNIHKKIELILKRQNIKDALILIDERILKNSENEDPFYKGPVYNHTPLTSHVSYMEFYSNYLRYYFSDLFFLKHITYDLTSNYNENWMKNAFSDPGNKIRTAPSQSLADSLIENDFTEYKKVFKPDYTPLDQTLVSITKEDSAHLVEIRKLLSNARVRYKFVIPPDFMGNGIRSGLHRSLNSILGKDLYDLSAFDQVSMDSTLNYENLHFTAKAGALILDSLYHKN
jgi:hypothetical protein